MRDLHYTCIEQSLLLANWLVTSIIAPWQPKCCSRNRSNRASQSNGLSNHVKTRSNSVCDMFDRQVEQRVGCCCPAGSNTDQASRCHGPRADRVLEADASLLAALKDATTRDGYRNPALNRPRVQITADDHSSEAPTLSVRLSVLEILRKYIYYCYLIVILHTLSQTQ